MTLHLAIQTYIIKYFYTKSTGYPSITQLYKYFFARIITHGRKSVYLDFAGIDTSPSVSRGSAIIRFNPG